MYRCLITLAAVVVLSYVLNSFHGVAGRRELTPRSYAERAETTWVRTADGWEPSGAVEPPRQAEPEPALHPLLVAGFMLTASLIALVALAGHGQGTQRAGSRPVSVRRKRKKPRHHPLSRA